MKAAIFTDNFDPDGDRLLTLAPGKSKMGDVSRRRTRVKTLDGGYAIEDRGYSPADRSMSLVFAVSESELDYLRYLTATYTYAYICIEKNLYYVSIARLSEGVMQATLFVDVEEEY
ncbi:hypothetical protein [Marinobacter qingdaonensis]|uniref:Uncharacterized protein n=1 Tax=Marinobacter qingdaonensis TaxID=3108486 RepID=A0ABU5NUP0_9GAMM|nr:hypothetical protein [Marinobacter sp. ASW11-75]MEA1079531.1 hypothetical protein [Marinobacter sp. ASW11-75]